MTNTTKIPSKIINSVWIKQEYPIYPTLGLVSTIAGTLIAIFILPADTTTPDALFPCAIAMASGLAIAPLAAAYRSP